MDAIWELNPRMSVSMNQNIDVLLDSDVLEVKDVSILGVKGADFYVYPVNGEGKTIENQKDEYSPDNRTKVPEPRKTIRIHLWHDGSDDTVEFSIDEIGDLYEDKTKIDASHPDYESLQDISGIILNGMKPDFTVKDTSRKIEKEIYYYEVGKDKVYREKSRAFKLLNKNEMDAYYKAKKKSQEEKENQDKAQKSKEDKDNTTDEQIINNILDIYEGREISKAQVQRMFKIGYARATRILDNLVEQGKIKQNNSKYVIPSKKADKPVDETKKSDTFADDAKQDMESKIEHVNSFIAPSFELQEMACEFLTRHGVDGESVEDMSPEEISKEIVRIIEHVNGQSEKSGNDDRLIDLSSITTEQDLENILRCK